MVRIWLLRIEHIIVSVTCDEYRIIQSKYSLELFFFRTQTTGPVATPTMTTLLLLCLPSLREEGLWLNLLHRSPTTILSNSPRLPSTDRQSCRKDCRNWPSRQENSSSELIILTAMSAKYEISIYCFRISHFELFFPEYWSLRTHFSMQSKATLVTQHSISGMRTAALLGTIGCGSTHKNRPSMHGKNYCRLMYKFMYRRLPLS